MQSWEEMIPAFTQPTIFWRRIPPTSFLIITVILLLFEIMVIKRSATKF